MKILSVEQIREADAYTIKNEPIASIDLMERAAFQLYQWMRKRIDTRHTVHVFAGPGNNGGDGLVLARLLLAEGYQVRVYVIRYSDKVSEDFQANHDRLLNLISGDHLFDVKAKTELPEIGDDDVIVDALFGSGLTRPVTGLAGEAIRHMNRSGAITIAIDIPSGLFADKFSDPVKGMITRADYTLSFQMPKLAFLLPSNDEYVGKWKVLNIGLSHEYINSAVTKYFYMLKRDISPMLKQRRKFEHKGNFGHALLIAGSYGKMGAAILASRACLRSGVGLLHTHIPISGYQIMQTATPETMVSIDRYDNHFSEVPDLSPYQAIGAGPGLGTEKQSQMALKMLIQQSTKPLVFDADALNILALNKTWLGFLPKGTILTPHPGEFKRLAGSWSNDFEKLQLLKNFASKHSVYVVLKGAYTATCFPDGQIYFNSTGNPGMATAGSGDVLTGMITGLLTQGYTPGQAAVTGVFLHGLAGDLAAKKKGEESLIAGDIIEHIAGAFAKVRK